MTQLANGHTPVPWAIIGDVTPTALMVYVTLARHANERGYAAPSLETLAADLELSPRTVTHAITQLAEQGWIIQVRKDARGNIYKLPWPEQEP